MSMPAYPVRVDASSELRLNRWLWLVKWLLALPHYLALAFLWLAFVVLSIVAFVAIAVTGRYPRQIFDFNVGVLRWSWRVAYYAYGALGTDQYPPFTLADIPDYPAHLEIAYPHHLSRGLVLVKWWLLAVPHYLIVAILTSGGVYVVNEATAAERPPWTWGGGLIGLLVLVAAVILLFTGSYPRSIFNLVLGLNRWVLRVAAYAALMTDEYPPFRLDQGPDDPASSQLALSAPAPSSGSAVAASSAPSPAPGIAGSIPRAAATVPRRPGAWSAGRVVAMVTGCLVLVIASGFVAAGAAFAVAQVTAKDDAGFYMSEAQEFRTSTYAIVSSNLETHLDGGAQFVPDELLGDIKLTVTAGDAATVFIGIGPTTEVQAYLANVAHTTVTESGGEPVYWDSPGEPPTLTPAGALPWVAWSEGTGTQDLVWSLEDGDWSVMVINADRSADVAVDMTVGAQVPAMDWGIAILLSLGACLLIVAAALMVGSLRAGAEREQHP